MPDIIEARPQIDQSTVVYAYRRRDQGNTIMYEYKVDASMSTGTNIIWTNRRDFNLLNFTFRALYKSDYDTLLAKPTYVSRYVTGIVEGEIYARHTKYRKYRYGFLFEFIRISQTMQESNIRAINWIAQKRTWTNALEIRSLSKLFSIVLKPVFR